MESQTLLLSQDLVDTVWNSMTGDSIKPVSTAPILIHPIQYSGSSWQQKLVRLSDKMNELQLGSYVITALDEIAWLFNLRGADLPFNPLFKAYVLICKYQAPQPIHQQVMPMNPFVSTVATQQQMAVRTIDIMQVISVTIYTDLTRITPALRDYLGVENSTITLRTVTDETSGSQKKSSAKIMMNLIDYDLFVKDLSERFSLPGKIFGRLAIPIKSNVAVHTMAKNYQDRVILSESLLVHMKGVKSDIEVHNMREAHIRDSLAICMLLAQLDSDISADVSANIKLENGNNFAVSDNSSVQLKWNEITAANQLELYRKLMQNNKGLSFATISAFGSNGAIIHYGPSESTSKTIDNSSMYLLDSGGQYLDGTTDITRTTHFGQPNDLQRETYTRVLMGSIDMMMLRFPAMFTYKVSDILARRYLYEIGLDYAHGTGHGIGAYGLVHEAPSIIAKHGSSGSGSASKATTQSGVPIMNSHNLPIEANMMSSVEPGYYKQDDFGIRIEDIVVVKNILSQQHVDNGKKSSGVNLTMTEQQQNKRQDNTIQTKFLGFEPMSLVPYEPKLIKFHLLSEQQKSWLNQYNRQVRNKLIALIKQFMNVLEGRKRNRLAGVQQLTKAASLSSNNNNNNSTYNSSNKFYNGLIDDETLRLALQRAHLWILLKTESIPMATKTDQSSYHSIRYFDQLNDDANNRPTLSYSVGAGQNLDNQQEDIGNYRCDQTVNPKSCGLFMMAANQFHQTTANTRNGAAQLQTHEPIIYFISLIIMQSIILMAGRFY